MDAIKVPNLLSGKNQTKDQAEVKDKLGNEKAKQMTPGGKDIEKSPKKKFTSLKSKILGKSVSSSGSSRSDNSSHSSNSSSSSRSKSS